jgi:hypothetical protein
MVHHSNPKSEIQISLLKKFKFFLAFYWISNDKNYSSYNIYHTLGLEFKKSPSMQSYPLQAFQ